MLNMVNFVIKYGRSLAPVGYVGSFLHGYRLWAQASACALFAFL